MFLKRILLIGLLLSAHLVAIAQPQLKFLIRVDDILSRNTTILPRSITPFQDTVASRGGKVTWGVMPHRFLETPNLDGALAQELRKSAEDGHELSLHGWIHICQRCGYSSHEMFCTTYNTPFTLAQQRKLINDGLNLMVEKTGVRPISFIPPGHVNDSTTWRALLTESVPFMSTTRSQSYLVDTLYNLPPNEEYTWQLTQAKYSEMLTNALKDIREKAVSKGVYNMLFHDPFTRRGYENGIVLKWTAELLDSLNAYYGDKIEYLTLSEASAYYHEQATSQEKSLVEKPERFSVEQNFPNPFNPSTEIRFSISQSSAVEISIYDVQGRKLETLLNQTMSSGLHSVSWNASSYPSGIYLYRVSANGEQISRKMTLIK